MGLSVADAANFLGNLDKNGVDASTAMAGLKKAMANATAEGVPLDQALAQLEGTLKSGKTDTEAYQAAMELFGNKAGPALAQAIQQGQISFTDLQGTLTGFAGSVESTFDATLDPMDQMTTTMNELKLAGADLGEAMIQGLAEVVTTLTEKFRALSPEQQETIVKIGAIVAAIGPLLMIGGKIIVGIGSVISTIGAISGAITAFIPVIAAVATAAAPFLVGGAIVAGIIAAGVLIYQNWDTIKQKAQELWDKITQVWEGLKQTVSDDVEKLKSLMNFEWKLPNLKLPHISITGELSLSPPSAPHIGIEWYKKAYNNGVLFR